jgi:hypothetical protein
MFDKVKKIICVGMAILVINQWISIGGAQRMPTKDSCLVFVPLRAYMIYSKSSGKCLQPAGLISKDGTAIVQWEYIENNTQKWSIIPIGMDIIRFKM